MSIPLATLPEGATTIRWREPYVSDGLNRKLHGPVPRGINRGGNLTASLAVLSVEIAPDPVTGDSVYTYANADGRQVTVREVGTTTLSLNTGGIPGTTVYIGLEVSYVTDADTEATWRAYSQVDIDADEKIVVIGKVEVPASGVIPAANITLDRRRDAWQDQSTGMRDWRQIVEGGNVDLPVPGKAADRFFPYFAALTTGSVTIENSDNFKRSLTHSFRFGGSDGIAILSPHTGDGISGVLYPVREGQRILYSFYVRTDNWTYDTTQRIRFAFRDGLSTGASFTVVDRPFTNSGPDVGWVHITGVVESPYDGWFGWEITSHVDAGNSGYLYIDDIRIWKEVGDALEDDGQRYIMGINRQIEGSALALFPAILPDDEATWADSTIRLINTSPADGSAISAKITADPVNDVDLFDWTIEANTFFKGAMDITPPADTDALTIVATGSGRGIFVESEDNVAIHAVAADAPGIYSETPSLTAPAIAAEGKLGGIYAVADGTGVGEHVMGVLSAALDPDEGYAAFGMYGMAEGSGEASAGVFGKGEYGGDIPTVKDVGGVFWGKGASEEALGALKLDSAQGAGVACVAGTDGLAGVFYGENTDSGYYLDPAVIIYGGDALSDGDGHTALKAFGGDAENGAGEGGIGVFGQAGERGPESPSYRNVGVVGLDGPGSDQGYGVYGRGDKGGGLFDNPTGGADGQAIVLSSGVDFRGISADQNPAKNITVPRNVLKAKNAPKAWGKCYSGASPSLIEGFNINGDPVKQSPDLDINLRQSFTDEDDMIIIITSDSPGYYFSGYAYDTDTFRISCYHWSTGNKDLTTEVIYFQFVVFGIQTLTAFNGPLD